MTDIKISKQISLPIEIVTQTISILAKRRAGKSYTMRKLVEQLLKKNQQVILVDPKGDQWGIRSSADGKRPGFPIVILGGEHGDAPLEATAGEVVAKLAVEERVSILLDLSSFRKHEIASFMAIFLENLYRLKAQERYRTPVMLVIDEADAIAPQRPQKGEERMLGAAEDIVRRGGQRGIGCALITQRSAVLNKNVLTQAQMLIVLRTIAPQDLAAINAWIEVHGEIEQKKILMESLPSLPIGDAWFWSPGWPTTEGIFGRSHVLPIETFDSGATPKPGHKQIIPKNLADVDLDVLKKQMADTIEKAKADNPNELKKEIERLKREVAVLQGSKSDPNAIKKAVDAAISIKEKEYDKERSEMIRQTENFIKIIHDIGKIVGPYLEEKKIYKSKDIPITVNLTKDIEPGDIIQIPPPSEPLEISKLGVGELAILKAIAQQGDSGITRPHITAITGYKKSSRDRYISTIKSYGYIDYEGEKICINSSGMEVLGPDFERMPTGSELREKMLSTLPEGEAKILRALIYQWPNYISREVITEVTGYQKPTRDRYLSTLKARELIETESVNVKASDDLFK